MLGSASIIDGMLVNVAFGALTLTSFACVAARSSAAGRTVALLGLVLSAGCGGAQQPDPPDARVAEVRRLAVADLRCDEDRIQLAPIGAFAECERREAESIDEETGVRSGPMGRCLAWSEERTSWPVEGWAASGCGFVEQYLEACGTIGLARHVVPGIIDCAMF